MTTNWFMQILAVGIGLGTSTLHPAIAKTANFNRLPVSHEEGSPGEPPALDSLTGLADELTTFYLEEFEWRQELDRTAQGRTDRNGHPKE